MGNCGVVSAFVTGAESTLLKSLATMMAAWCNSGVAMPAKGIERDLEHQIAKLEAGTTDQIFEYLALITGEYYVVTTPPKQEGGK